MAGPLDLSTELHGYNVQPAPFGPSAVTYEDRTPTHRFTTVVAPLGDWGFVTLTSRDGFDADLARTVVEFVQAPRPADLAVPARLLEGFHYAGTGFNGVLLVGPSVHRQYQTISPRLHDLTLVAFPVFPGEFSGDEKPITST